MKTTLELADRFEKVSKDFKKFIADNDLEKTVINMREGIDRREVEKPLCDTPACHGGWAAIIYEKHLIKDEVLEKFYSDPCPNDFFLIGVKKLSGILGFSYHKDYENWAKRNPDLWGNLDGDYMFFDPRAFGSEYWDCIRNRKLKPLLLSDITNHYQGVADRIRESLCEK